MPSFCAVPCCRDRYKHNDNVSFHKFPFKKAELLKQWIKFVQRESVWKPSKWSSVCSRHFSDNSFNYVNGRKTLKKTAVPSILNPEEEQIPKTLSVTTNVIEPKSADNVNDLSALSSNSKHCRLCANLNSSYATFANNFELFGILQKCFPTLNICADDDLPKEICCNCQNRLECFASFIDEVYNAQSKLQLNHVQKCNTEKLGSIKQEPVLLVKQEIPEESNCNESHNSEDLDIDVDVAAHVAVPAEEAFEQKFSFNDFSHLNMQDIVKNCDIMEIVNLDEPFIDIPDDDVLDDMHLKQLLSTAHQLQLNHSMQEEHSYATFCAKIFKREKDASQLEYVTIDIANGQPDLLPSLAEEEHFSEQMTVAEVQEITTETDGSTQAINTDDAKNQAIVTAVNDLPVTTYAKGTKPNIVVLNESIVKSADAFKLHNCQLCQTTFFRNELLQQHYEQHNYESALFNLNADVNEEQKNFKIEKDNFNQDDFMLSDLEEQNESNNIFDLNFSRDINYAQTASPTILKVQTLQIDQQQSQKAQQYTEDMNFMTEDEQQQQQEYLQHLMNNYQVQQQQHDVDETLQTKISTVNNLAATLSQVPTLSQPALTVKSKTPPPATSLVNFSLEHIHNLINQQFEKTRHQQLQTLQRYAKSFQKSQSKLHLLDRLVYNYKHLSRHYHKLLLKCKHLERNMTDWQKQQHQQATRKILKTFKCNLCVATFSNIHQLLQHKKQNNHFFKKRCTQITRSCYKCNYKFTTSLALQQHERYACKKLQAFKNYLQTLRKSSNKPQVPQLAQASYCCDTCLKIFTSRNSLRQHKITHLQERKHQCTLCERYFKRRNGLMQHMRAIHLQIRPHKCVKCKHAYALKTDMLRCRHSGRYKQFRSESGNDVMPKQWHALDDDLTVIQ